MATGLQPTLNSTLNDKDTLAAAQKAAARDKAISHEGMIPAKIVSYDRTKNRAVVQPLIMMVDVANKNYSRNPISDVPCMSLGGGGFTINFPLAAGDLGWIHASDRDLSLFLQTLSEQPPSNGKFHSFDNCMFVPDVFNKYTLNGADSTALVIQSLNSNTRISLHPNGDIDIISPGKVTVTAATEIDFNTPLAKFSTNVQILGTLTVTGTTNVNGGFTSIGGQPCTLPTTTTIGGITVTSHGHTSSSPGTRTSGGMLT